MDTQKNINSEIVANATDSNKQIQVYCKHCQKLPGYIKQVGDADEVGWALECDCKQTPFMRSTVLLDATWNSVTFGQTPKEAYQIAVKESPPWTKVFVPSHAK